MLRFAQPRPCRSPASRSVRTASRRARACRRRGTATCRLRAANVAWRRTRRRRRGHRPALRSCRSSARCRTAAANVCARPREREATATTRPPSISRMPSANRVRDLARAGDAPANHRSLLMCPPRRPHSTLEGGRKQCKGTLASRPGPAYDRWTLTGRTARGGARGMGCAGRSRRSSPWSCSWEV